MPQDQQNGFVINGVVHTPDDLTFREQREMRKIIRDLVDDPDAEPDEMAISDVVPAFVFVVMKRDDPDLKLDTVLDMKLSDFVAEASAETKRRPTRAAKAATSGPQS